VAPFFMMQSGAETTRPAAELAVQKMYAERRGGI
jgi:hypothetical protein